MSLTGIPVSLQVKFTWYNVIEHLRVVLHGNAVFGHVRYGTAMRGMARRGIAR